MFDFRQKPAPPTLRIFLQQDLLSTCNTFRDYFRGVILEGAKYTQGVSKITNEELETYNVEIKNRCEFRIDVQ